MLELGRALWGRCESLEEQLYVGEGERVAQIHVTG